MAIIGELAVNVVARTDKLTKGLKGARKQVDKMSKGFKSATRTISNFTGAILGGFGIFAVVRGMSEAAESIDKLAKSSQKLGIATEELAGLHVAASRTGVEINQLEMGLQRMVRRVSEAAMGMGEAKDAIAELGIDARRLNALAPEKQFSRIAQAMSLVTNQSDKIRLAFKLFDSEGVNLIRTLDLGAKGLAAMRLEAVRLGDVVSEEDAKKVEKMADALGRLSNIKQGLGKTFVIALAPGLERFLEGLDFFLRPPTTDEPSTSVVKFDPRTGKRRGGKTNFDRSPLSNVEPEGVFEPFARAVANTVLKRQGKSPLIRMDIHTQGVPLRQGEVMSPAMARRLVTVNEEQLRQSRMGDARMLGAIKEQTAEIAAKEKDVFELNIP